MTPPPESDVDVQSDVIAADLLALARARIGREDVTFADAPARLPGAEGTVSYTFTLAGAPAPLDGPLVLRLFPGAGDEARAGTARRARFETAVHQAVAALGYPCPRAWIAGDEETVAGMHFVVLERLPGQPLWARMMPPSRHAFGAGALLAEAQLRLHALDPAALETAVAALGAAERLAPERMLDWTYAELEARGGASLRDAWQWLRAHRPAAGERAICHAALHPQHVLVDGERFVGAVGWTDVQVADPHFDVAQTVVLLHFAPIDAPPAAARALDAMRRALQVQYRRAYARRRPLDDERLAYFEAFAIARRLLQSAAAERAGAATGWAHPDVRRRLAARLRGLTGVDTDGRDGEGEGDGDGDGTTVWV